MNLIKATSSNINALLENNEGRLRKVILDYLAELSDTTLAEKDLYVCDEIPRNWSNGTGYLDHGVNDTTIPTNAQVIGLTSDRRLVHATNTPAGNVILFDRYMHGKHGVVVANGPSQVTAMYGSTMRGQLSDVAVSNSVRFNLGDVISRMIKFVDGYKNTPLKKDVG